MLHHQFQRRLIVFRPVNALTIGIIFGMNKEDTDVLICHVASAIESITSTRMERMLAWHVCVCQRSKYYKMCEPKLQPYR